MQIHPPKKETSAFVRMSNISYSVSLWNNIKKNILEDITLEIQKGEIVLLLGRTGSGKTCLAQTLTGLHSPSAGSCYIDDIRVEKKNLSRLRKKVGYVFQNPEHHLILKQVKEDIAYGWDPPDKNPDTFIKTLRPILEVLNLPESILIRNIYEISESEKRKVAIAGTLIREPALLILDEPLSGFDFGEKKDFSEFLHRLKNQKQRTLLMITHELSHLYDIADRILILDQGKIVFDGSRERFRQSPLQHAFLSDELLMLRKYLKELKERQQLTALREDVCSLSEAFAEIAPYVSR